MGSAPPSASDDASSVDWIIRALAHAPERTPAILEADPERVARFTIIGRLGQGGMGVVYRAVDDHLQRSVALKLLPREAESDPQRRRRFLRETRSAAAVTHPNIATVYEVGEADGRIYLAMEMIDGETLRARLRRNPLAVEDTLRIARQLLDALAHAHEKGIVHCDLKPDNVMLDAQGRVKVLDFGLARMRTEQATSGLLARPQPSTLEPESPSSVDDGRVMGTPGYMAPEQAKGLTVDARTDLFALGVTLYEMLDGARPFHGDTPLDVLVSTERDTPAPLRDVPPAIADVVSRCLAKNPDDRYVSARDVMEALALSSDDALLPRAVGVTSAPTRTPLRIEAGWSHGGRRRAFLAALAAGIMLAGLAIGWRRAQLDRAVEAGARAIVSREQTIPDRGELRRELRALPRAHILWVDDHPEGNAFEVEAFERAGVAVDTARTNAAARDLAGRRTYDLIITDIGRDAPEAQYAGLDLPRELLPDRNRLSPVVYYVTKVRSVRTIDGYPVVDRPSDLFRVVSELLVRQGYSPVPADSALVDAGM
jgi:CheY-like chemotaxis protein